MGYPVQKISILIFLLKPCKSRYALHLDTSRSIRAIKHNKTKSK